MFIIETSRVLPHKKGETLHNRKTGNVGESSFSYRSGKIIALNLHDVGKFC